MAEQIIHSGGCSVVAFSPISKSTTILLTEIPKQKTWHQVPIVLLSPII